MRRKTDLDGVKSVAKGLVMVDIHLTEYALGQSEYQDGLSLP